MRAARARRLLPRLVRAERVSFQRGTRRDQTRGGGCTCFVGAVHRHLCAVRAWSGPADRRNVPSLVCPGVRSHGGRFSVRPQSRLHGFEKLAHLRVYVCVRVCKSFIDPCLTHAAARHLTDTRPHTLINLPTPSRIHTYIILITYIHASYMHAHTCIIHTYIHASYIHQCTYMHACMHTYVHACVHTYIHTYIHTYLHACIHACMRTCIHTYILCTY